MTGKELSAVLAECAARTEIARAGIEEDRRKHEAVMAKHEGAIVKHEEIAAETQAATRKIEKAAEEQRAMFDEQRAEADARWEESARRTDAIIAELKEHRDERRALLEAIFRVMDRLDQKPPPPPHLRSV